MNQVRRAAGVAALVALVAVAVTGALLTWRYRPDGGLRVDLLAPGVRWSESLVRWHVTTLAVGLSVTVVWTALTAFAVGLDDRRRLGMFAAAVLTTVLVLVTALTWYAVQWDQLGLREVMDGTGIKGLWYAAFSDQVRFILRDGVEVPRRLFAALVVVHLVAPVAALASLVTSTWLEVGRHASCPVRCDPEA